MDVHDALLIVDVQNDFCPGGALPVEAGHEVVPVLNAWIRRAQASGAIVVASRDWHPPDHVSFHDQGGPWPHHCIRHTSGAAWHPDLALPADTWVVSKGTDPAREGYSAFDGTDLAVRLRQHGIQRLWVGGLALDICVRATVLDARRAGWEVHVIRDAVRAADTEQVRRVLREMELCGAILESCRDHGGVD